MDSDVVICVPKESPRATSLIVWSRLDSNNSYTTGTKLLAGCDEVGDTGEVYRGFRQAQNNGRRREQRVKRLVGLVIMHVMKSGLDADACTKNVGSGRHPCHKVLAQREIAVDWDHSNPSRSVQFYLLGCGISFRLQ